MPKVWVVRADGGQNTQACVDGGFIGIGWENVGDLTCVDDKAQVASLYEAHPCPDESKGTVDTNVSTIWRFREATKSGDWIITPAKERRILHYGKVVGEYRWVTKLNESSPYPHCKDVKWSSSVLDRHSLSLAFQKHAGCRSHCFQCAAHQ